MCVLFYLFLFLLRLCCKFSRNVNGYGLMSFNENMRNMVNSSFSVVEEACGITFSYQSNGESDKNN